MKFRHPAPLDLKQSLRTKRGLFGPVSTELVVLKGVILSGLDREDEGANWSFVMYDCRVKANARAHSISIATSAKKVRLYFAKKEDCERWQVQLNIATMWRLQSYYDVDQEIGSGKYSTVYRAWDKVTRQQVAVKVVWKADYDLKAAGFVERERKIMELVDHHAVVRSFDIFDEPSKLCIVLEYMSGGMLFNVLKRENSFSELNASMIMRGVFIALEYLHSNNIVHRDIKPDNILCPNVIRPLEVKVADFGLSNFLDEEADKTLSSGVGTPYYVAPEMVLKKSYGCSVDMWSCGVLLYLLLAGRFPFKAHSKTETLKKIRSGIYTMLPEEWSHVSEEAADLVQKLLVMDPKHRMTASEALNHSWIAGSYQSTRDLGTARMLVTLNAAERGRDWIAKRRIASRDSAYDSAASKQNPIRTNSTVEPLLFRGSHRRDVGSFRSRANSEDGRKPSLASKKPVHTFAGGRSQASPFTVGRRKLSRK